MSYVLPLEPKKGTKHKLTGTTHPDQPKTKKGILTNKKAPPKVVSKPGQPNVKSTILPSQQQAVSVNLLKKHS